MPTYQYACTDCDHAFEQVQSFSEDSLTTCPECQGRLRKIFNAVGVVFKGSGFYRTDNRPEKKATGSSAESSSGSSGSDTGTSSTANGPGSSDGAAAKSGAGAKAAPAKSGAGAA